MTGPARVAPAAPGLLMLVDDAGDDTGMLVAPAADVSPAAIAAMVRHGSGFLFVTLSAAAAVRLDLPAMDGADAASDPGSPMSRQRVSVDAAAHVGTGISARDRARTAALLADPTTVAPDLTRPGHVVPVVVDTGAPRWPADRAHLAVGGPAVYAAVPGGAAGTGLAAVDELRALAAALGIPVVATLPTALDPPVDGSTTARTSVVVR